MPVRIYDIAKKLGVESKRVLARARELGITGVKQASSSLDKITAEYLEHEIGGKSSDGAESGQTGGNEPVVVVPQEEPQKDETTTTASGAKSKRATETASSTERTTKKATTSKKTSKQKATSSTTKKGSSSKKTKSTAKSAESTQKGKSSKQATGEPKKESKAASAKEESSKEEPATAEPVESAPTEASGADYSPAQPESAEPVKAESAPMEPEAETGAGKETEEPPTKETPPPAEPSIGEAQAEETETEPATQSEPEPMTKAPAQPASEPEPTTEAPTEAESEPEPTTEAPAEPATKEEAAPPSPPKPKVGDKIGWIELPNRPSQRREDRGQASTSEKRAGQPSEKRVSQPGSSGNRGERRGDRGQEAQTGAGRGPSGGQRGARGGPGEGTRRGEERRQRTGASGQGAKAPSKGKTPSKASPPPNAEVITLKQPIIVRDLAEKLRRKPFQLIADLMEMGVFANVNQSIDEETAKRACAKYNYRFEVEKRERGAGVAKAPSPSEVRLDEDDKPEDLQLRPPVITIMGHVDHGKTTLLDKIRKANVVADEQGGMTQHIGAYTIAVPHPERPEELKQITFLDTPGHEAFSAMRSRGTNVTDIVILVVAADDGVMPQTMEALNHAQAANVPVIVAVNKCDHPNANPQKTRQQFQAHGLVPEEWGGQTIFQDISAVTEEGIQDLLEMISLQAEVMELKANPKRNAVGTVIESALEPGGPVATVIVRKGTLRLGEAVLCGQLYGRVRALIDDQGKRQKEAGPSVAVKVLGLSGVPDAGEEFAVVKNERLAREIAEERAEAVKTGGKAKRGKVTLESLFDRMAAEQAKTLKVVVKADTQGSAEAIVDALKKIKSDKVSLEVVHNGVGSISESDILLASASKAIIIGFHTKIDSGGLNLAKREGVQIKQHTIIYQLIDDIRATMAGMLDPVEKESVLGTAEVRQVFSLSKNTKVAGCMVTDGRILKGRVKVLRNDKVLHDATTQSLRRFQDEVNEVRAGLECGIRVNGFDQFQVGDRIQSYSVEKVPQQL